MKVVLFCGGLGMRLREYSETIPKPMVTIGYRPIIWHLMKYYAFYGHTEFILCLGYRGDVIKQYFLNYDECLSNDFQLSNGGKDLTVYGRDMDDWKITFVDTGLHANIGQRLLAVRDYLDGEEMFLANYTDNLSNLPLPEYLAEVRSADRVASCVCVRPYHTFHVVSVGANGLATEIRHVTDSGLRINGGFFALRPQIFDFMRDGEELVEEPFARLIAERQLLAYRHDGFWACMDTFKDKSSLDELATSGNAPWEIWKPKRRSTTRPPASPPRYSAVA